MKNVFLAVPIYILDKKEREKNTRLVEIINEEKVSHLKKIITFKELSNGFFIKEINRLSWEKEDIRMIESNLWKFLKTG